MSYADDDVRRRAHAPRRRHDARHDDAYCRAAHRCLPMPFALSAGFIATPRPCLMLLSRAARRYGV